jgi:hypothetical protein
MAVEVGHDFGNLLVGAATARLSVGGRGLFVVPTSFFLRGSVLHDFPKLALGIEAALALPPGTFVPHTNIATYLVLTGRHAVQRMFVAQLSSNTNTNAQIIDNLQNEREGGTLDLGRFV